MLRRLFIVLVVLLAAPAWAKDELVLGMNTAPGTMNPMINAMLAKSVILNMTERPITAYDADPRYASIIAGLPGHPVEDVQLSNIRILYRGGLTLTDVRTQALANNFFAGGRGAATPDTTNRDPYDVPDGEKLYPEPSMFGVLPSMTP